MGGGLLLDPPTSDSLVEFEVARLGQNEFKLAKTTWSCWVRAPRSLFKMVKFAVGKVGIRQGQMFLCARVCVRVCARLCGAVLSQQLFLHCWTEKNETHPKKAAGTQLSFQDKTIQSRQVGLATRRDCYTATVHKKPPPSLTQVTLIWAQFNTTASQGGTDLNRRGSSCQRLVKSENKRVTSSVCERGTEIASANEARISVLLPWAWSGRRFQTAH